jgi:hypothetical protein
MWLFATVPDGMCWLAPQSLYRTVRAADFAGLTNHGLTCLPSLHDCLCNQWNQPPVIAAVDVFSWAGPIRR